MKLIESIRNKAVKAGLVSFAMLSLMSIGDCGGFDLKKAILKKDRRGTSDGDSLIEENVKKLIEKIY